MHRNRIQAVLSTLLFVFFVNFYIDHRIGSSGVAVFLSGLLLFILSVADRESRVRKNVWIMSISTIVAIGAIVSNGSGFVQFIATGVSLLLLAIVCYLTQSVSVSFDRLSRILMAPWELFVGYMRGVFRGWAFVASSEGMIPSSSKVVKGIVGLVIGLPIAFILLGLFSSADPIFGTVTRQIFSASLVHTIVTHLYVSCIVFAVFIPVGFIVLSKQRNTVADWIIRVPFASEMSVVSLLVSLVTGAFLWVQWPYVFARVARETDLAKFGVATYSEYVKRGFGEFIVIACLLYVLLWLGLLALRSNSGKKFYLKILQTVMLGEVFLFVVSIFRRVWLYQQFHGLTLGRVYGAFFLIWVTMLLVTVLLRHIRSIHIRWVSVEIIGSLCLFAVFAYGPIETMVAVYDPPTVNNRIDSVYLSHLSSSGYVGWQNGLKYARIVLTETPYDTGSIITATGRQSIGYAGMIVQTLTISYFNLVTRYGSPEEQQSLVSKLLKYQKEQIMNALPEVEKRAADEKKAHLIGAQYGIQEKNLREELVSIESLLSRSTADPLDVLSMIQFIGSPSEYSINSSQFVSFFTIHAQMPSSKQTGRLDRLFDWNKSDADAYARMNHDISIADLLHLHKAHEVLVKRIAGQPESERSSSFDVSFDGPFLTN